MADSTGPQSDEDENRRALEGGVMGLQAELERIRKEGEEIGKQFHQQLTLVIGTIGAITFAGLVLIIEDPTPFKVRFVKSLTPQQNFHGLVTLLACVCVLTIFSVFASSFTGAGIVKPWSPVAKLGYVSGLVSLAGLIVSVYVIVQDITDIGNTILLGFLAGLCVVFAVAFWLSHPSRPTSQKH